MKTSLIVVSPYPLRSGIVCYYLPAYVEQYRNFGYQVEELKIYFWESKWKSSLQWLKLAKRILKKDSIVILQQHTPPSSGPLIIPFLIFCRLFSIPTLVFSHELMQTYAKYLSPLLKRAYYCYEWSILRLSNRYIVHTRLHREELTETLCTRIPIHIVPLPVPKAQRKEGIRKFWGFYGMISKKKGVDLLLEAYQSLEAGSCPPLRLMGTAAPGETLFLETLKTSIKPGFEEHIHFTGFIQEEKKPELFSEIAMMIFPYRWVSQSGTLAESCVHRIPYLASDVPYFRDFCASFGCGEIVELSIKSLAEALRRFSKASMRIDTEKFDRLEEELSVQRSTEKIKVLLSGL